MEVNALFAVLVNGGACLEKGALADTLASASVLAASVASAAFPVRGSGVAAEACSAERREVITFSAFVSTRVAVPFSECRRLYFIGGRWAAKKSS